MSSADLGVITAPPPRPPRHPARTTAARTPKQRVPSTNQEGVAEASVPDEGQQAPEYAYIQALLRERQRLYATAGLAVNAVGQERETLGGPNFPTARARSLDQIVRQIRLMRMQWVQPVIPRSVRKTSHILRLGSALLADLCIRVPALLTAQAMQAQFKPLDDSREAQEAATLKEEWVHAVLLGGDGYRALLDQGETSVWRDLVDNLFHAGRGGFLLSATADRWSASNPDFPKEADYADDSPDTPDSRRRSGARKYTEALDRFRRAPEHFPFVLENLDPLTMYVRENADGVQDEAVVFAVRPLRETAAQYGLQLADDTYRGSDVQQGASGARYLPGPDGVGRPYPLRDFASRAVTLGQGIQCVTYYCGARRALALGLVPPEESDPHVGLWAQYVDGILVQQGPLPGPAWHPLPVFACFGQSTAIPDPTYRSVPAVFPLVEACLSLDRLATMQENLAQWTSWAPIIEEDKSGGGTGSVGLPGQVLADPEEQQKPQRDVSPERKVIEPGGYYEMPAGRTARFLTYPPEAAAIVEKHRAMLEEHIQLIGASASLRGVSGGATSGFMQLLNQIASRSVYDPITKNMSATVAQAVKYTLWQIWYRFPEGVPAYLGGDERRGKKKGWFTLSPKDVAPDAEGVRKGTPFLACEIKADPLLPVDELQREQRGINALEKHVYDVATVREKYFDDPAPEQTAARVLADSVLNDPVTQAVLTTRSQVQQGIVPPDIAIALLAAKTGLPPDVAARLAQQAGVAPPPAPVLPGQPPLLLGPNGQPLPPGMGPPPPPGLPPGMFPPGMPGPSAIGAGGFAPGMEPVPGMPNVGPLPQPGLPVVNGMPPAMPNAFGGGGGGGFVGSTGGHLPAQPLPAQRAGAAGLAAP